MGHKRVIFTESTTAECTSVLKAFGFEEDLREGIWLQGEGVPVKAIVAWGKAEYYPELFPRIDFAPRVQVHFRSKEGGQEVEFFTRETVRALRNLDGRTRIRVFNPESGEEVSY